MEAMTKQYAPDTIQRAERVAQIFSGLPQDSAERVMELANSYLDGINTGIRLSVTMKATSEAGNS